MRREERLVAILDLLGDTGVIEVSDVVERFDVSPATARRDLDVLASRQLLTRTRGGASAHSVAYDLPSRFQRETNAEAKAAIARTVQTLIEPGMRIGLSGGTTCKAVAAALGQRTDLEANDGEGITVVTSAINIAAQLVIRPHIRVVVTGGVMRARSYELVGPYSDLMLERITLDVAIIGVNGIDAINGPMVHDEREARANALMASRADRAWVVTDSSKLGVRAFATVGGIDAFTGLVTDTGIAPEQRQELEGAGLRVLVAAPE
ncbi:DeoR/GlpR family DNA-binding transcription regulator [Pseudactinotalea sp.]|uniref:DeoR/GlpR family DNA-binding transcription regulator n=1 Tax=Pseudactinotalea sp. TaxID=1926260 RepID=UPI003B3AE5F8